MSSYLLDTHVLVWLSVEPQRVPDRLRETLEQAEHLFVSAASAYEIAQKVRLGKLPGAAGLLARWDELISALLGEELPLTAAEMLRAGGMSWPHRDPFDRMIAAQSQTKGLQIVTQDAAILGFPEVSCAAWE